ncbi:hypothetical protein DL98DRAFT_257225 [Cadophora sp. DSE1049]|nr:hypothetical protein DL98DRAFT_257225 [Cadophora sp. DSE1049]
MAPFVTVNCNFQLEGAKEVALVWDGEARPIQCTGGRYEASFKVYFENEGPKPVHFRVDNKTSDDHHLRHPLYFTNIAYTMSVKWTGDRMSISAEESREAKRLFLVPITPGGESATIVSPALPNRSGLPPKEKQELVAGATKALKTARTTLPPPPPPI